MNFICAMSLGYKATTQHPAPKVPSTSTAQKPRFHSNPIHQSPNSSTCANSSVLLRFTGEKVQELTATAEQQLHSGP